MPIIETIENITSLDELAEVEAKLRERKRALKKTNKTSERKIQTLTRRRERIMDRVRQIDAQIEVLRQDVVIDTAQVVHRRRGRKPKSETTVSA